MALDQYRMADRVNRVIGAERIRTHVWIGDCGRDPVAGQPLPEAFLASPEPLISE